MFLLKLLFSKEAYNFLFSASGFYLDNHFKPQILGNGPY